MDNSSTIYLVSQPSRQKENTPVFIEFTDEYKEKHGINNNVDKVSQNSLERSPKYDCFGEPQMLCAKMPSPKEVERTILLLPIILDVGHQGLNKIFDILDTWNERRPRPESHENCVARVLMDEDLANIFEPNEINPN